MNKPNLPGGVAHKLPDDFRAAIATDQKMLTMWQDITPLARNEWICWVLDAKKPETRARRIAVGRSKMQSGMRRPCCWAGCSHRQKSTNSRGNVLAPVPSTLEAGPTAQNTSLLHS
ncbi:MAG: YdeI/OmpD-associated family protein [Candidatus Saccharimonadales bacterium]|nr:YdeI/OmpD-associated family protein [Candidatus Saccharibacteria bacterium]